MVTGPGFTIVDGQPPAPPAPLELVLLDPPIDPVMPIGQVQRADWRTWDAVLEAAAGMVRSE